MSNTIQAAFGLGNTFICYNPTCTRSLSGLFRANSLTQNPYGCPLPSYPNANNRNTLSLTRLTMIYENVYEKYDLKSQFNRWTFLQKLLDEELPVKDVETILFQVLQSWVIFPLPERSDKDGAPTFTEAQVKDLYKLVSQFQSYHSTHGHIPILSAKIQDELKGKNNLVSALESLLPDEDEDPDGYEGLWNLINDLHGEESIESKKMIFNSFSSLSKNTKGIPKSLNNWSKLCLVARMLIHMDFLTKGMKTKRLE